MRHARVYVHGLCAGVLREEASGTAYTFQYETDYAEPPVSMTLPVVQQAYQFATFPPFFEGLLPEGDMLEGLLRQHKIDRQDCFSQLIVVGHDTVRAQTAWRDTLQKSLLPDTQKSLYLDLLNERCARLALD
ncbi:MAG: toxin HipA [Planctomycetes bacterium]|nr:toxin HipA [Planctomycetota bacterium]